jgi:hypothetical protein
MGGFVRHVFAFLVANLFWGVVYAGPYTGAAGQPGSQAISMNSSSFVGWAVGYRDYLPGSNVSGTFKTPNLTLGPATGVATHVASLGDSGKITLTFGGDIFNGPGADFAVFENSFSDTFLELAWAEVSSDGTHFFRFPGFSFTTGPVASFGDIDPTNIDGLAGKYRAGFGTPFDLGLLSNVPGLDVNHVRFVRIVDIVGDGSALDNYPPSLGGPHPIYDPFPTVLSGGFDLDAVGVIHLTQVPEPGTIVLLFAGLMVLLLASYYRARLTPAAHAATRSRRSLSMLAFSVFAVSAPISYVSAATVVSTFDDLPLAPNSFFFPGTTTTFTSGAATFNHRFSDFGTPGCCWDGWTYSDTTDTTTPGPTNQYSAFTGSGAGGSANYAVGFLGEPTVTFATPSIVKGADFTNTTYAALSMLQGDAFSKKFGGATGNDPDFFKLTIFGKNASGATTGAVDFFLADYRFSDNQLDYVANKWTFVDLSSLGVVSSLAFGLSSSDTGQFGINTPGYFAVDNLTVDAVPEPSVFMLVAGGFALLILARRRLKR